MSGEKTVQTISVSWTDSARADLRRIDKATAMNILYCLSRFLSTGVGDIKTLQPPLEGKRLRCGDYRLFFQYLTPSSIEVNKVVHRSEAYR